MNLARTRSRTFRALGAALIGLAAAGFATADAAASHPQIVATQEQVQERQIASSVLGSDYKVTLTALRSTQDEYAASVALRVYVRDQGAWKESDRATVGAPDGWFWYPLTGKGAVCEFSTASTEPAPVAVSLLVTPSIGCSAPERFVVKQGELHPVTG